MLKFVKGNLESINDVQIFPIISLVIFFSFFVVLIFYVYSRSRENIEEVSRLPLEEDEDDIFNINR